MIDNTMEISCFPARTAIRKWNRVTTTLCILAVVALGSTGGFCKDAVMVNEKSGVKFVIVEGDILSTQKVNSTDKLVYSYIKLRQGKNSKTWVAVDTIAKDVGVTINTARTSTQRLEGKGLIEVKRTRGGNKRTNHYRIIEGGLEAFLRVPSKEYLRSSEAPLKDLARCF